MCDTIIMPNGEEIDSFDGGKQCLCPYTHLEILNWILEHLEKYLPADISFDHLVHEKPSAYYMPIGTILVIERTPFGWEVRIVKKVEGGYEDKG
jgi:hypothetical protein